MTSSGTASLVTSAQTTSPPTPFYQIHCCEFCQVQEIDPSLREQTNKWMGPTIKNSVRYRGTRIIHGASNGCDFFKHCLGVLEPILKSNGYEQGSNCSDFKPVNWIYKISFIISERKKILLSAHGEWSCVKGELPKGAHTRGPQYLILAFPGTREELQQMCRAYHSRIQQITQQQRTFCTAPLYVAFSKGNVWLGPKNVLSNANPSMLPAGRHSRLMSQRGFYIYRDHLMAVVLLFALFQ
jgi:hypothetical protein